MPQKCFWCSKETPFLEDMEVRFKGKTNRAKVCGTGCGQQLRDFVEYAETHTKHYILGFSLSIIIGCLLTVWRIKVDYGALGVLIIFAGSGLTLIKYPFVTPQTVSSLGARKAIASGRILGGINILIGIAFWFFLAVYLR